MYFDKEYCFKQQSSFPQQLYFWSFQVFKFGSFILIQAFHLVTCFISEPLLLITILAVTEKFYFPIEIIPLFSSRWNEILDKDVT